MISKLQSLLSSKEEALLTAQQEEEQSLSEIAELKQAAILHEEQLSAIQQQAHLSHDALVNELQDTISSLQRQVDGLAHDKEELSVLLSALKASSDETENQLQSNQMEQSQTRFQLAQAEESQASIKDEFKETLQRVVEKLKEQKEVKQSLSQQLAEAEEGKATLITRLESFQQEINGLQEELVVSRQQVTQLQALLEESQATKEEALLTAQQEKDGLLSEIAELKQAAIILQDKITILQSQVIGITQTNNDYSYQLTLTRQQLEETQEERDSRIQCVVTQISALTEEKQAIEAKLQQQLISSDQQVESLKGEFKEKMLVVVAKLKEQKETNQSLALQLTEAEGIKQTLQADMISLTAELQVHQSKLNHDQQAIDDLSLQLAIAKQQLFELQTQAAQEEAAVIIQGQTSLLAKVHELEQQIATVSQEKEAMESQHVNFIEEKVLLQEQFQQAMVMQLQAQEEATAEHVKTATYQQQMLQKVEHLEQTITILSQSETNLKSQSQQQAETQAMIIADWQSKYQELVDHNQTIRQESKERNSRVIDKIKTLTYELSSSQAQLEQMTRRFEQRPQHGLTILARCHAGDERWCLILRQDGYNDQGEEMKEMQWVTEDRAIRWLRLLHNHNHNHSHNHHNNQELAGEPVIVAVGTTSTAATASFSIVGNDDHEENEQQTAGSLHVGHQEDDDNLLSALLPPSLEQIISSAFDSERQALLTRCQQLVQERDDNRLAFDRYRERARDSLRSAAEEQKGLDHHIASLQEEIKSQQTIIDKLEKQSRRQELSYHASLQSLQAEVQSERDVIITLKLRLLSVTEQVAMLAVITDEDQQTRLQTAAQEQTVQDNSEKYLQTISNLQDQVVSLSERELALERDMRRKGDTARQLLMARDHEIEALRQALQIARTTAAIATVGITNQQDSSKHQQQQEAQAEMQLQEQKQRIVEQHVESLLKGQVEERLLLPDQLQILPSSSPSPTAAAGQVMQVMLPRHLHEEMVRRAITRESELLNMIRLLKAEVNSLRGRLSLLHHYNSNGSGSSHSVSNSNTPGKKMTKKQVEFFSGGSNEDEEKQQQVRDQDNDGFVTVNIMDGDNVTKEEEEGERQQRLVYLRQAFISLFTKAKGAAEMQALGRVICAILGVSIEEQAAIMDNILKLSPAVVASSTIDSFTQQLANIFS